MSLIPDKLWAAVYARDNGICQLCGVQTSTELGPNERPQHIKLFPEVDHILPVSKGGATTIENLRLTCRRCNRKRKNRVE